MSCVIIVKKDIEVQMRGIERETDKLGRVVIPVEFRKELSIKSNTKVIISLLNGEIIVKPKFTRCLLCGKRIEENSVLKLCCDCIVRVKEYDI